MIMLQFLKFMITNGSRTLLCEKEASKPFEPCIHSLTHEVDALQHNFSLEAPGSFVGSPGTICVVQLV